MKTPQRFYVSLKAVVAHENNILLVQLHSGFWELPGGRIDEGEESILVDTVLARELYEEIGASVTVRFGPLLRTFIAKYTDGVHGLMVERLCWYEGGEIVLSHEHKAYQWVDRESWKGLEFMEWYGNGYWKALETIWAHPLLKDQPPAALMSV